VNKCVVKKSDTSISVTSLKNV